MVKTCIWSVVSAYACAVDKLVNCSISNTGTCTVVNAATCAVPKARKLTVVITTKSRVSMTAIWAVVRALALTVLKPANWL